MERKGVQLEVWPVATDESGVWLRGDDALYTDTVPQDHPVHFEVVTALADAGFTFVEGRLPQVPLLHSTSWRDDGPRTILTYVAVADVRTRFVLDSWPQALPITDALLATVGAPPPHAADERPMPRNIDVLTHAVRHLAFLRLYDATSAAALPAAWEQHLAHLQPTLAGLYSERHAS